MGLCLFPSLGDWVGLIPFERLQERIPSRTLVLGIRKEIKKLQALPEGYHLAHREIPL